VLGAGASAPFAFPLGRGLLLRVIEGLRSKGAFFQLLGACGFDGDHMTTFARELEMSMQPSVDAFLENRPEFLDVGKAIAAALIPYESENNLQRPRDGPHWYEYLFNRLGPTRADYEQSQLSVITFNYDRSFEHFLFLALRASFGLTDDEGKALLQKVPLVHVHGQLGALDYISPEGRPYRSDPTPTIIRRYAREIRIVYEAVPDDPQFRQAHDWLSNAEVVCFLGFGYLKSNIERLRIDVVPTERYVFGSAFGLTTVEVDAIKLMIGAHRDRLYFGRASERDVEFLRNVPVFG
jgi:hypothetical protein